MESKRVWAEVNLRAVAKNTRTVRRHIGKKPAMLVVVKANGYGHGSVPIAQTVLENGADRLGVANTAEAIQLRQAGVKAPIHILGGILEEEVPAVIEYNIIQTISDIKIATLINEQAEKYGKKMAVHIKVDTGMGRMGVLPEHLETLVEKVSLLRNIKIEGLCTHLSSVSDGPNDFTRQQIKTFKTLVQKLDKKGFRFQYLHAANSAALSSTPDAIFNMVRPGIVIYGMNLSEKMKKWIKVEPVLTLKAKIVFLKEVPKGWTVGYDRTFVTKRPSKVATIPVGYKDGYEISFSNRAHTLVNGNEVPVIGRVSMDYTTLDVTEVDDVKVGDEVILIGKNGKHQILVEDLAKLAKTIPYDITCSMGERVVRFYVY